MMDRQFWREVFTLQNSVTPGIKLRVAIFGLIAAAVWAIGTYTVFIPTSAVAPYELIGVALAVMLMIRSNAGYDRWYEGRKLWGGIVNQSRSLAQLGLVYGPRDRGWREQFVRYVAAYSHACRHDLRDEGDVDDMRHLLDDEGLEQLSKSQHYPLFISNRIAGLLRDALETDQIDRFVFLQAEQQRASLMDHIGACERILKTPLAGALSVKIRRFLFIYLLALPFGIFDKAGIATPFIVMLVAYPLLSLDQISVELQNPFSRRRLSHLPLEDICSTIQKNLFGLLEQQSAEHAAQLYAQSERCTVWTGSGDDELANAAVITAQHSA